MNDFIIYVQPRIKILTKEKSLNFVSLLQRKYILKAMKQSVCYLCIESEEETMDAFIIEKYIYWSILIRCNNNPTAKGLKDLFSSNARKM